MSGVIMTGRRRVVVLLAAVAAVVVAAAVVLVGLRGNGSEVDATRVARPTLSTSSPSSQPTATTVNGQSTLSAPVLPRSAQVRSEDGAQAFLRFFIDLYNYSYVTLDSAPLTAVSTKSCGYCADVIRDVEDSRKKGLRFVDGVVSVRDSIVGPDQAAQRVVMVAFIDQTAGVVYQSDGSVEEKSEPLRNQRVDATVIWANGNWKMQAVTVAGSK